MAPVADTRTSTDARLEQRQIREATALDVQKRDTILREIATWQPVLHAVKAEIAAHLDVPVLSTQLHALAETTLIEKRNALTREIEEKTAKVEDLAVKADILTKQVSTDDTIIAAKAAHLEGLKSEVETWAAKGRNAADTHASELARHAKELTPLVEAVDQARNHLAGVQLEEEVLLQNRAAEEQRISVRSRDLAVYESRIRAAAAKVNMQINL